MDNMLFIPKIHGVLLDDFLERGWYRTGSAIFTTDYIITPEAECEVWWIRYKLNDYELCKSHLQIIRKSQDFRIVNEEFRITFEMEELYDIYKHRVDFSLAPNLRTSLFSIGNMVAQLPIYDTRLISIYHNELLVAYGVYDLGQSTLAGILNIFDHDYAKYSFGKLLMIQKIKTACELDMAYYYPGYISFEWDKFDYKLFLGKEFVEIYVPEDDEWVNYCDFIKRRGVF